MSMFFNSFDKFDSFDDWGNYKPRVFTAEELENQKYDGQLYADNHRNGKVWVRRTKTKFELVSNEEIETMEMVPVDEEGKEVFYLNDKKMLKISNWSGEFDTFHTPCK